MKAYTVMFFASLWNQGVEASDRWSLVQKQGWLQAASYDSGVESTIQAAEHGLTDWIHSRGSNLTTAAPIVNGTALRDAVTGAVKYLHDAKRTLRSRDKVEKFCSGDACRAGVALDLVMILHAFLPESFKCEILVTLLWWAVGLSTLMIEGGVPFYDAVHVLAQQITTIGYGTNTPTTDGMKLFHALHGFVGQMDIYRQLKEAAQVMMDHIPITNPLLKESLSALCWTIATTAIFTSDFHATQKEQYPRWFDALLDGFYTTIISMTTIGYGDYSFSHNMTKLFSPFILSGGVISLERWYEAVMERGVREEQYPRFCTCFTLELRDFLVC